MARLAQDIKFKGSGISVIDQFDHSANSTLTTKHSRKRDTQATRNSADSKVKQAALKVSLNAEESSNDGNHPIKTVQELKPKKRSLNKIRDNPLLRPLDLKSRNMSLLLPIKDHETIRRNISSGSKAQNVGKFCIISQFERQNPEFDSDGLSDFIVSDSSSVAEESSDGEFHIPLPHSTRKLLKGRKRRSSDSLLKVDESKSIRNGQQKAVGAISAIHVRHEGKSNFHSCDRGLSWNDDNVLKDAYRMDTSLKNPTSLQDRVTRLGLDESFSLLQISPYGHEPNHKILDDIQQKTPCSSSIGTKNKLVSPKRFSQIPPTLHQPSVHAFWSQDAVDEWNDECSPEKPPKIRPKMDNLERHFTLINEESNPKSPAKHNRALFESKKSFIQKKHVIAEAFLQELDSAITAGRLSQMAASTGGVKIIWSKRLNSTAGRANWKLETVRPNIISTNNESEIKKIFRHHASIELAEKVIDNEDRLLNVIAHEFCHLSNFMISGIKNNPHGKEFKNWAAKCSEIFGDRGIHVTTKHSYDINYKYNWRCSDCGMEFKRHSKSIDPLKHRCGSCKGKLVQNKPEPRSNITVSDYQLFIKNNMKSIKEANPGSPQQDIMVLLGKMYQEHKHSKQFGEREKSYVNDIHTKDNPASEDLTPNSNTVEAVAENLKFLNTRS